MKFTYDPEPAARPFTEIYADCDTDSYRMRVTNVNHDSTPVRLPYCADVEISMAVGGANPLTLDQLREAHEMLGMAIKEVERRNKEHDKDIPF